jgi:hypothetical protein
MMEIDRVKALQRLEEQEQQLKTVRQRGAREIRTQVSGDVIQVVGRR